MSELLNGSSLPVSIERPYVCVKVGIKHFSAHVLHMEVWKPVAVVWWRPDYSYCRSSGEVVAHLRGYFP